jgi:polysaccharide export outer membrane protein
MRSAVLVLVLVILSACPGGVPNYPYKDEPAPPKEIVLGVGDVVGINVWEQKDLTVEASVRADGKITMPLAGDLEAIGRTPSSLRVTITERIAKYVKDPIVTVAVKAWKSYRFTIDGEVTRPGVFSSEHFLRVSDAIAMASGLSRFARRNGIKLFRTDPQTGKVKEIPLDYDALASGRRPDMNIWILPGDSIHVP